MQAPPSPADAASKVMNNYIGIGIDAKVALQFHSMRDNFPAFFQSQLGNKMWYTGGCGSVEVWRRGKRCLTWGAGG
eukprot:44358-Chlamydomonas_euryale.AAC.1